MGSASLMTSCSKHVHAARRPGAPAPVIIQRNPILDHALHSEKFVAVGISFSICLRSSVNTCFSWAKEACRRKVVSTSTVNLLGSFVVQILHLIIAKILKHYSHSPFGTLAKLLYMEEAKKPKKPQRSDPLQVRGFARIGWLKMPQVSPFGALPWQPSTADLKN